MDVLRRRETPGAALSLRKGPRVRGWGAWGLAAEGGGGTRRRGGRWRARGPAPIGDGRDPAVAVV